MEDLFNTMAGAISEGMDAPFSQEMMDDSVARAADFFDFGNQSGLETDAHSVVNLEVTSSPFDNSFHFGDHFFAPESFANLGLSEQNVLDLCMTHEGTGAMLHGMDVHFDGYQEELCGDFMAGVRAGLDGIDMSQIGQALADIPHEPGHADGSFRAEAFSDGFAFANEYMETHHQAPVFNECLESYSDGHLSGLSEQAQLGDQLYMQECETAHLRHVAEANPENVEAKRMYYESMAKCHDLRNEYAQKYPAFHEIGYGTPKSTGNGTYPNDGEYHPSFGYKDDLYTKSEIASHKHDAQNKIDHQESRIHELKHKIEYESKYGNSNAKLSSLNSSLNDAIRKLNDAKADLKAWENTKPKKD